MARDASDLFEYLHEPTASCFLSLALDDLQAASAEAMKRAAGEDFIGICLRESGKLIGDLFAIPEGDTVCIGWNLNPHFAGKGYAFEAGIAMVNYLFEKKHARRLYAYVETTNKASMTLCEKLGMRREGVFKEFVSFRTDPEGKPVYEDTMQYALLRNDWSSVGSIA
jgi:[ribosomal protein S5]-alanine N-acetyltransferase